MREERIMTTLFIRIAHNAADFLGRWRTKYSETLEPSCAGVLKGCEWPATLQVGVLVNEPWVGKIPSWPSCPADRQTAGLPGSQIFCSGTQRPDWTRPLNTSSTVPDADLLYFPPLLNASQTTQVPAPFSPFKQPRCWPPYPWQTVSNVVTTPHAFCSAISNSIRHWGYFPLPPCFVTLNDIEPATSAPPHLSNNIDAPSPFLTLNKQHQVSSPPLVPSALPHHSTLSIKDDSPGHKQFHSYFYILFLYTVLCDVNKWPSPLPPLSTTSILYASIYQEVVG